MSLTVEERFWSKVIKGDDSSCWIWTGAKVAYGHGRFRIGNTLRPAHIIAYEWIVGPIPIGFDGHHKCFNPSCVAE